MSVCPVWWIPPFLSGCLICLQNAFQTVNAKEEEEGYAFLVLSSNYLVILTSVFLEDANFTKGLHLTLQPPVICSLDETGLQTSVIADVSIYWHLALGLQQSLSSSAVSKIRALIFLYFFPSCIVFFLSHCFAPFSYSSHQEFLHLTYLVINIGY